jgi:starvation-inducible outer membrane lipoprotein
MISRMRFVLLFLALTSGISLSGCASGPDDPDQVKLPPTIKQQRQDARQKEEFAKALPPPRG